MDRDEQIDAENDSKLAREQVNRDLDNTHREPVDVDGLRIQQAKNALDLARKSAKAARRELDAIHAALNADGDTLARAAMVLRNLPSIQETLRSISLTYTAMDDARNALIDLGCD
jgi:hypothetical protein